MTIDGGTITNTSGTIDVTGPVTIDGGASISGAITVESSATLTLNGVTDTGGTITNDGTIAVTSGTLTVDSNSTITGTGTVQISNLGIADFQDAFDQSVMFTGVGTLELSNPTYFTANPDATISGLVDGDAIDLANISVFSITSATIENATLVVDETGGGTLTFNIAGDLGGNQFDIVSDHNGDADLVLEPTPPSGTIAADQYVWGNPAAGGSWDDPGNWEDTTAGSGPASFAPGSDDSVTIVAPGSGPGDVAGGPTYVITGTGIRRR